MGEEVIIKSIHSSALRNFCIGVGLFGIVADALAVFIFECGCSFYWLRRIGIYFFRDMIPYGFFTVVPFIIIAIVIYFVTANCELTVTTKRVYGQALFRRRVDLPIDSISAVATSALQGISIATSAGRITFLGIGNNIIIREEVSKLLMKRQEKEAAPTTVIKETTSNNEAEQLKQFKELLDSGAITQEEYDAKKKQILGI